MKKDKSESRSKEFKKFVGRKVFPDWQFIELKKAFKIPSTTKQVYTKTK